MYFDKISSEDFLFDRNLDSNNTSYIYGEVDPKSFLKIVRDIDLNDCNFLDIGSGLGKLVIYLAINTNFYVDGIEIDKVRYNKSISLLDNYEYFDKVEFFNDDFTNKYFGSYNFIYCCNLVFDDKTNNKLYKKIEIEFKGIFILFNYPISLEHYLIREEYVKTSWSKKAIIFIFNKN